MYCAVLDARLHHIYTVLYYSLLQYRGITKLLYAYTMLLCTVPVPCSAAQRRVVQCGAVMVRQRTQVSDANQCLSSTMGISESLTRWLAACASCPDSPSFGCLFCLSVMFRSPPPLLQFSVACPSSEPLPPTPRKKHLPHLLAPIVKQAHGPHQGCCGVLGAKKILRLIESFLSSHTDAKDVGDRRALIAKSFPPTSIHSSIRPLIHVTVLFLRFCLHTYIHAYAYTSDGLAGWVEIPPVPPVGSSS